MSEPLWQKGGVRIDRTIMRFLAGSDVVLDREFLRYDIRASRAHAEGLQRIGLLSADELAGIVRELAMLDDAFASGGFVLDERHEDGHSAIEAWLTERLGDVGRKIHTGRSRNDQILVATRLWLKDRLDALMALCGDIARIALDRAAEHERTPMPGYTHLQRAVVSTVGHWYAGYAEAFIDNAIRADATRAWIDANPLGTAAGFGVNLPLDRDYTTHALGFARQQINPAYAQLSRGKFELAGIEALGSAMIDLRRLAWDLSLFTTAEYGFVALPDQYTTGSSIMPNKRNPDVVELMRAAYAPVAAARVEIEQLLSLPSGYQRDLQLSKGSLVHAFGHGLDALSLLPDLLAGIRWDQKRMGAAIDDSMHATDIAVERAVAGIPFRDAYRQVADASVQGHARTAESSIEARTSPGACGHLSLDTLRLRLADLPRGCERSTRGRSGPP